MPDPVSNTRPVLLACAVEQTSCHWHVCLQVARLDTQLALLLGQDEVAAAAAQLLRGQLADKSSELAANGERLAAAEAAHAAKGEECARYGRTAPAPLFRRRMQDVYHPQTQAPAAKRLRLHRTQAAAIGILAS